MNEPLWVATPPALIPNQAQGAVRLTGWGLIRAVGPDATQFLQGQLTNDLAKLPQQTACLAGYCSAKGRLLASFVVWRLAADDWLLACSADILPQSLKRLSMFVMRAKCKLSDASAEFALWGLAGDSAWPGADASSQPWRVQDLPEAVQSLSLPDAAGVRRWLVCAPQALAAPELPALELAVWDWLEVASGLVRIVGATVEAFVPQMVNFEAVGGVDFKKGCYPGQEVVARSQYRGTLKRRGALVTSGVELKPGQELFHDADPGQPAGLVALSASLDGGRHLGFVELKLAAQAPGSLHLGAADGPLLQVQPLPYALARDED